jgi:hypothetical protein
MSTDSLHRQFILDGEQQASSLWAFLRNNWKALAGAGKPLLVTVEHYRKRRSNKQNARYWAILQNIADNAWVNGQKYSAETWHEFFKGKFIGYIDLPYGGMQAMSSAGLKTDEFAEYTTQVEVFGVQELGVKIDKF